MFDKLSPKQSFLLGIVGSLGILFAIGFFILLGMFMSGDTSYTEDGGTEDVANVAEQDNRVARNDGSAGVNLKVTDKDHIRGKVDAPITLIEFSDFECPFCAKFKPTLDRLLDEYPNDVRLVYKHFPLNSIHRQAQSAAEASECAASLGGNDAFWEYHDLLFENQRRLGSYLYTEIAKEVGVDVDDFNECLKGRVYASKVQADQQMGIRAGVSGTPGTFINGQLISGAVSYGEIKAIVDAMIGN